MKSIGRSLAAFLIALLWMPASGWAQEPPAPGNAAKQEAKPADQPAQQEPEKKEEAEEAPARHRPLTLSVGLSNWDLRGSEPKFRQFATPPRGLFLRLLKYDPLPTNTGIEGFGTLKSIGEKDFRAEGDLSFNYGRTHAEGFLTGADFFEPAFASIIPPSERDVQSLMVKQFLTPGFSLSARYRLDEEDRFFEAPNLPFHQRTRYADIIGRGRVGPGLLNLSFADWRYFDRTGVLFDTKVARTLLSYLWQPTLNLGIEGAVSRATVRQPGVASNKVDTVWLAGDYVAGSATDLGLVLRRDTRDAPVTQNAYVREQRSAEARVSHRFDRWTSSLSLRHREAERLRGDQTFVDVPKWTTLDARVVGRIAPGYKLSLRGATENLRSAPPMVTEDPRTLYWTSRRYLTAKLDGGEELLNGYLVFAHREWKNSQRASRLTGTMVTIGGTWQASPLVSVFAEYGNETWSGRTGEPGLPNLGSFTPNNNTFAVGVSWLASATTFLSLDFSGFATRNDNPLLLPHGNTRGNFLTLNGRHQLARGHEVQLTFAPWAYRDRVARALNYDTAILMVSGSVRY